MNLIDKFAYVSSNNLEKIAGWKIDAIKSLGKSVINKIPKGVRSVGKELVLPSAFMAFPISEAIHEGKRITNNIRPSSLKFGSCSDIEKTILEDSMNKYEPVEIAKLAFLSLSFDPLKLYKIAKVEPDEAIKLAMSDFKHIVSYLREREYDFNLSKTASKVSDITGGDAFAVKVADAFFSQIFPKLKNNNQVKIAVLNIASEAMKKEAAPLPNPNEAINNYLKYIVPIGLVTGATSAAIGEIPSMVRGLKNSWNHRNAFQEITAMDPALIDDFGEDKVKKSLDTVYSIAPNFSGNTHVLTDLVRQVASVPAGGLSIGYLSQLAKANKELENQSDLGYHLSSGLSSGAIKPFIEL